MFKRKLLAAFLALGLVCTSAAPRRAEAVAGLATGGWAAVIAGAVGAVVGVVFTSVGGANNNRGFLAAGIGTLILAVLILDSDDGVLAHQRLRFGEVSEELRTQLVLSAEDTAAYEDERFELNAWVEEAELFLAQSLGLSPAEAQKILASQFNETGFQPGTVRVVRALLAAL